MTAPQQKKPQTRETITLVPYHWSAYNRIVGRGIGVYFARKWLRELKPVGAAIVQYLRAQCYANHQTGEYRYEVELDLQVIAEGIGVSLSTVKREFKDNAWLGQFVQRQTQYEQVGSSNRVKKVASLWFVSLDDPIHPHDLERYEAYLRDEGQPAAKSGKTRIRRPKAAADDKGQNDTYGDSDRGQNEPYRGQNDLAPVQSEPKRGQNDTYLPTVVSYSALPLGTSGTAALAPKPKGFPPEGEEEPAPPDPLSVAWQQALIILSTLVNKPTFEAHIRTLRPVERVGDIITLSCPSDFTREWILKRHETHLKDALSAALEQPITVQLVPPPPPPRPEQAPIPAVLPVDVTEKADR